MKLSSARINHLAHLISDYIEQNPAIECFRDQNDIRLRIKNIITNELRLDDEIDREIKRTLNSLSKCPPEGSKEWDVLYEKYYDELVRKKQRPDTGWRMT